MDAGYPPQCPSLPAYLLMTSGTTHGVCDDAGADAHPIGGASIFSEAEENAGLQWRSYAESMQAPVSGRRCRGALPRAARARPLLHGSRQPLPYLGTCPCELSGQHMRDDVAAGRLPAYAFVTPDACDDMHGAAGCRGDLVAAGDQWLAQWLPQILAGPDYRAGRLLVVITWDEGSTSNNHIPTVAVTPTAHGVSVTVPVTHCGVLALEERLPGPSAARLRPDGDLAGGLSVSRREQPQPVPPVQLGCSSRNESVTAANSGEVQML